LAETHFDVCGGHIGSRALTAKVFRQGFYWPLITDDASKLITTCQACQKFLPNSKAPFATIPAHHTFMAVTEMGY
jgi:hypothetical protein